MEEKKEIKIQEYLSPSSINTYYKCPRSYHYNYLLKLPQPPSIHLVKGSVVHKVLEDFFRKFDSRLLKDFKPLLDTAWKNYARTLKKLELAKEDEEREYQDCFNMIDMYLDGFKKQMKGLRKQVKKYLIH